MQRLTDLQWSRTNLSVPLSAYLQFSLPGKGNNDKCSVPPASTGSVRHWLNPKFALTLVYLVCLPWGPRGHALPQLGRRRGKGIQYHLAELSRSLGPRRTVSLTKVQPLQSLAACRNTKLRSLIGERKIQASMPATASARFLARTPPSHCGPVSRASSSAEVFHTPSAFSESGTGFPPSALQKEGSSTGPPLLLAPLPFSASKQRASGST